jgi:DNA polymerase III delta prime subunit
VEACGEQRCRMVMDSTSLHFALDCSYLSVIIPPIERRGE